MVVRRSNYQIFSVAKGFLLNWISMFRKRKKRIPTVLLSLKKKISRYSPNIPPPPSLNQFSANCDGSFTTHANTSYGGNNFFRP